MYDIHHVHTYAYSAPALNLNNNPAYEAQTPLQRNIAYEDTTHNTREPEASQTAVANPTEPAYEIIPITYTQTNATTYQGEDYNKLNREIP